MYLCFCLYLFKRCLYALQFYFVFCILQRQSIIYELNICGLILIFCIVLIVALYRGFIFGWLCFSQSEFVCSAFMVMWSLCFCTVSTQQCLCMVVSIEMEKCCVNQLCCARGKLKLAHCWLWYTALCEILKSNTTDVDLFFLTFLEAVLSSQN